MIEYYKLTSSIFSYVKLSLVKIYLYILSIVRRCSSIVKDYILNGTKSSRKFGYIGVADKL